ncbi:MAG: protein kinase [Pseudomonadales bacterium]|nr:protein kinase [Pseudomonadales bacterium]
MSSHDDEKTLPSITGYGKKPGAHDDATRIMHDISKPELTQFHDKTVIKSPPPTGSSPNPPQAKQILKNRFILEEIIGSGGMGVVYKAKDMRRVENHDSEPYVAIKLLNEEFKQHPEAVTALQRETKKTQTIAHPNIVSVYDFDRDDQDVFMTMEYMEGKPLDKLIKQYSEDGLPAEDTRKILKSICSALIYAHGEKIIHSDLKPSNIFINKQRNAKVFDFGIARAVAEAEHEDSPKQKQTAPDRWKNSEHSVSTNTIFDAGTLGALTPAYASLEMLRLENPDVRDDVYALGCVAYEMFTGRHPFNKLPADKAYEKNLKPEIIKSIPKKEWQAIESALRFKRQERTASVRDFISAFQKQKKRPVKTILASIIAVASLSIFITYELLDKPIPEGPSKQDIRNELELEITLSLHKQNLDRLTAHPLFTEAWQNQVWQAFSAIKNLIPKDFSGLKISSDKILALQLNEIERLSLANNYQIAIKLLNNTYRYTKNTQNLDNVKETLNKLIIEHNAKKTLKKIKITPKKPIKIKVSPSITKQHEIEKESFALAEKNVKQHLECKTSINMRDFSTAVKKLASLNNTQYQSIKPNIIDQLSSCLKKQGKTEPERAIESKRIATRLFDSHRSIASIKIIRRDHCDTSIAGLGARGLSTSCTDIVGNNKNGPRLVVVPGNKQIKAFAISKHEISRGDYSLFCKETNRCDPNNAAPPNLPITNISFSNAKGYIRWLTQSSGYKYRLPSYQEWLYSSKTNNTNLDPNRNCTLSTRGIQKGGRLVSVETGRSNAWGIINSIGNAREWVYAKGRKLVAVGGSYQDPIESCSFSTKINHSGNPDKATGFRVIRELTRT